MRENGKIKDSNVSTMHRRCDSSGLDIDLEDLQSHPLILSGSDIDLMRGSRNFRQGGGPGQPDKKSSDVFCFFFSPHLFFYKSNS